MLELKEIVKVVNELMEICVDNPYCDTCPFWDKEKGECQVQMQANVENPPEMW